MKLSDWEIEWDWKSLSFVVTVPRDSTLGNYLHDNDYHGFAFEPIIFVRSDIEDEQREDLLQHERVHIWQQRAVGKQAFFGSYFLFWSIVRDDYYANPWEWMAKRISGYP